jgi:hypothetical protein
MQFSLFNVEQKVMAAKEVVWACEEVVAMCNQLQFNCREAGAKGGDKLITWMQPRCEAALADARVVQFDVRRNVPPPFTAAQRAEQRALHIEQSAAAVVQVQQKYAALKQQQSAVVDTIRMSHGDRATGTSTHAVLMRVKLEGGEVQPSLVVLCCTRLLHRSQCCVVITVLETVDRLIVYFLDVARGNDVLTTMWDYYQQEKCEFAVLGQSLVDRLELSLVLCAVRALLEQGRVAAQHLESQYNASNGQEQTQSEVDGSSAPVATRSWSV